MEKAKGNALGETWYQLPKSKKCELIKQIVQIEAKLAAFAFPEHGCIYYTKDLPLKYRPKSQTALQGDDTNKFCIGPVVDPGLWSDGRSNLPLSRGPWHALTDYARSIGTNGRAWALQHAQPRINYFRSNTDREMPHEYLDLIDKYLEVVPRLTRHKPEIADLLQPTVWHHDLYLNNIYVDAASDEVTHIIDWQGVKVAPLILQARIPRMVRHSSPVPLGVIMPERPDDYENLPEADKLRADKLYESAICHKLYEVFSIKQNPRHYAAICHNDTWQTPHIKPIKSINEAWSNREVFTIRSSLMGVVDHWSELSPGSPCPISFSEDEKQAHNEEIDNRDYLDQLIEVYQNAGILPADGVVDPEDYDILHESSYLQKEKFLSLAEDDEQREWLNKIWPYQDRPVDA
ncbi:phosphotransferase family protein [Arthroderma uncinatum]|uniref:phosphotransferase family protein n=1 Tax=Arthroderma uncinatum TaxID=74035 RepID=UPI00144ACEDB|nr:phosphotransferase family protein [Arthroderma uncinatum]KAF3483542.1 phosphotransferase family protein [Arthroderma uncinatum]